MDQFEEIVKRNKKIMNIVCGVPLFLCILAVIGIAFCVLFFIDIGRVQELADQISADQNITDDELSYYINGMEKDGMTSSFLAYDPDYNVALLSLYLRKGDYDKIIERSSIVMKKDDSPIYHYYLGMAYAGKDDLDNTEKEMTIVAISAPENMLGNHSSNVEMQLRLSARIDSAKKDAASLLSLVKFKSLTTKIASDNNATKDTLVQYLRDVDSNEEIMNFGIDKLYFNILYLELCLRVEDYDRILARAPEVIKSKDAPLYHYYLAVADEKTGKSDLATEELKTFLDGNIDTASNENWAKKVELARISVANDYYTKGNYAQSKDLAEKVLRERIALATGPKAETLAEFETVVLDRKEYALKSPDSDQDGLSDNLEDLIGTDKNNKDSDGDGYEDKKELLFGHNPSKKSPDDELTDYEQYNMYSKVFAYYPSVYNQ